MKFKVGDKVKAVRDINDFFKKGDILEITECYPGTSITYEYYRATRDGIDLNAQILKSSIELYNEKEMTKTRLIEMCDGGKCVVPVKLRKGNNTIAFIDHNGEFSIGGFYGHEENLMYDCDEVKNSLDVMKVFAPIRLKTENPIWEREDKQKQAIINEIKEAEEKLKEARKKLEKLNEK